MWRPREYRPPTALYPNTAVPFFFSFDVIRTGSCFRKKNRIHFNFATRFGLNKVDFATFCVMNALHLSLLHEF